MILSSLGDLELLANEVIHRSESGDITSLSLQVTMKVRHRRIVMMQGTPHRLHMSRELLSLRRPGKA